MEFDGNADHSEEVVQEVFTDRVRRTIAGNTDWVAKLADKRFDLVEGVSGDTRIERRAFSARNNFVPLNVSLRALPRALSCHGRLQEITVVEQGHLASFAEHG